MLTVRNASLACALFALPALSACSGAGAPTPALRAAAGHAGAGAAAQAKKGGISGGKIQHVVYIIQENRSFNNLFNGFKGATTQDYGYDQSGTKIPLHAQSISTDWDIAHGLSDFLNAYDYGANDGWNNEGVCCKGNHPNAPYAYAPKSETKPYWDMAEQYALSDMTFQSNLDGSFVSHQYAIAGYANSEVNYPGTYWSCVGGPSDTIPTITQNRTFGPDVATCENYTTLGDEMDAAGVSWRFYTSSQDSPDGLFDGYAAVDHIFNGPDFTNDVISPQAQFITDVGNGTLAAVTWITPTYVNSDHGGVKSNGGPAWVASLVNAVGESKFWDSTAVFIIWDDWGGWYDPVLPVYKDYDGLGYRVPLIMVSPYAKAGYVSHVQYESSSVLRFMEDNFGLAPMQASDTRAADPGSDAFNFSQKPIAFKPIPYKAPKTHAVITRPPVDGD